MLRNAPTSLMLTAAYFFISIVLLLIDDTRDYATIMLYVLPVIIVVAGWSIFTYGKSLAKKLKDDEFGYGG